MRLALAVLASLLPLTAAQVAPPANTTPLIPTAAVSAPVAASVPTPAQPASTPQAPAAQNPNPNPNNVNTPANANPNPIQNPPAAAPTPTPTTPTFQFDMNPSSVYTACKTQDVIWHYRPEPEKKNITIYVYNEAAASAGFDPVEATRGTIAKPSPQTRRRSRIERLEEMVKRQAQKENSVAQRIVKDHPANVAYSWVVDVPPGMYKFLAIVDGAGGDIAYPLQIVGDTNMTCVKDFGLAKAPAVSSSVAASASGSASAVAFATNARQPSASPSVSGVSKAAGAAASAGAHHQSDNKSSGISGGAIAGIVIGVIAGIALLALLAFCCVRKKRRTKETNYHVDPYAEPVREVRGGGFAPMAPSNDHDSVHQTSSFGHDLYGGMVDLPPQGQGQQNPFETEPNTPNEHQTHTPNSSTGNASMITAPMSHESDLAYPPPVMAHRASAQSGTSTFESAQQGSIQTFGHESDRSTGAGGAGGAGGMNSFPSNRSLPIGAQPPSPPMAAVAAGAAGAGVAASASSRRLPPAPLSPPQRLPPAGPPSPHRPPPSPQRLPPTASPTTPERGGGAANIAGGAPVPSAYAGGAGAATESGTPGLERKISSRRKPVPRLSEDEEAALGSSPPKSSSSSSEGLGGGVGGPLRLPKVGGEQDDWGSGLEAALARKEYTLTADPPLHQD